MPNRVQIKFIEDALDQDHKLSAWECDFIESLSNLPEDKPLTDRQNEILNRISQKLD